MKWALIFGIPLAALGVAGWSAWQIHRTIPQQADSVVMMLPGELPVLNPFLPGTEATKQIVELLHEPLVRLNDEGRLGPGLADRWDWHLRMTCWFATTEEQREAQRLLAEVSQETRQKWELEEVTANGQSLILRFAKPGAEGTHEALRLISNHPPLPLTFLRLTGVSEARTALEDYAGQQTGSIARIWFDDTGDCELVTTRPLFQVRESLADWFRQKNLPVPNIRPLAEIAALLEPVLDFDLNASRATWADGSPITAADVRETVAFVRRNDYPVPGREGFRHIQDITPDGTTGVQVTYRRSYGAALASWVEFPILPASWIQTHSQLGAEPPPGAGEWLLKSQTQRLLTLERRNPPEPDQPHRLYCIPAASPLQARVALATKSLDVIWPADAPEMSQEQALSLHSAPPRNRLLVLWNTRSSCLSEQPVREALALGVNLQSLWTENPGEVARGAEPLFAPGLWFSPDPKSWTGNPTEATSKLEGAGWLKDVSGQAKKGGQGLTFELLVTTGNPQRERLAHELAGQWQKLGASVTVTAVPPQELVPQHLAPGKFDAVIVGLDYELSWDQTAFWHSTEVGHGLNFSQLTDPQLDLLLEALAAEFDPAQLPARAQALQDRLMTIQPALPLIGDFQEIGLRKARFPQMDKPDLRSPLTLRHLLHASSAPALRMRLPNE